MNSADASVVLSLPYLKRSNTEIIPVACVMDSLTTLFITRDLKCSLSFMSFERFSSHAWPDTVQAPVVRKVDKSLSSG